MKFEFSEFLMVIIVLVSVILIPIALQYYLSTRRNKWFGLVLPGICVLYSMLMMLQVTIFSFDSILDVFVQLLIVFLLSNIPTLVLVVIYAACREKRERKEELEKMQVSDLE